MSQASMTIADSNGAVFLTALNNALAAIASSHSGASLPSEIAANMLYVDTSGGTPVLRKRNNANSAEEAINFGLLPVLPASNPSAVDEAVRALAVQSQSMTYAADSGSADAISVAYTPAITALVDGMVLGIKVKAANTGATTVNANSLGATNLKKWKAGAISALESGDLVANQKIMVTYDSTNDCYILLTPVASYGASTTVSIRNYYSNLYVANKAVTALNSVNCVVDASAKTFTRASGSWLTDGFAIGDGILTYGFGNSGNNSYFIISNVNATVITCSAATGLVNETGASTGFWCCNRDKITADCAVLRDSSGNLKSYETISVAIDMTTTGANALDTGTFTAATWYYKYLIGKSDGTIAGLASTSSTSPTLPSGYTYFLRVSAAYAVTGVRFYPFMQSGQVFYYIGTEGGTYSPPNYYATTTANLTDRTSVVAVAVPPIALEMLGTFNPSATVCYASLCWDSNSQRGFYNVLHPTDVTYTSQHGPWWYPLNPASPQTVYIRNPLGAMSYLFRGYKLPI